MQSKILLLAGASVVAGGVLLLGAQNVNSKVPSQPGTPKKQPIQYTIPASGEQMYREYCSACHGTSGGGDGGAVPNLTAEPANLRTLAKANRGKYPALKVHVTVMEGVAHGSGNMPAWGPLFRQANGLRESFGMSEMRAANLTRYVETMQEK